MMLAAAAAVVISSPFAKLQIDGRYSREVFLVEALAVGR